MNGALINLFLSSCQELIFPPFLECCMYVYLVYFIIHELDLTTSDPCLAMLWSPLRVRFLYIFSRTELRQLIYIHKDRNASPKQTLSQMKCTRWADGRGHSQSPVAGSPVDDRPQTSKRGNTAAVSLSYLINGPGKICILHSSLRKAYVVKITTTCGVFY